MSDLDLTPMHKMLDHCHYTAQRPTEWRVSRFTFKHLKKHSVSYTVGAELGLDGTLRVFGIPVEITLDLPDLKFVLKAGENSVGADYLEDANV